MRPIFYTSDGSDETYVDDQHCGNCRFWGADMDTGKMKCKNGRSEKRYKETPSDGWCWRWVKDRVRSNRRERPGDDNAYDYDHVDG